MVLLEVKEYLELGELVDREFYDFYRKNRRKVAKGINQYNLFEKVADGLLRELKKLTILSEGGVHLKYFGYFCYIKYKNKYNNRFEKNPLKKFKKQNTFHIWFYPEEELRDWYLDSSNNTCLNKKLNNYHFALDAIKTKYELEEFHSKIVNTDNNQYKFLS